jgi:hypothetical protein
MKNFTLTVLAVISLNLAQSQVNPHAIGVRLGGSSYGYYGGEITYQHGFGDKNRLEIDLGARNHKNYSHLGVSFIYHWVWNITDGLNWYVGPGAQLGLYNGKQNNYYSGFGISVGGQIGLEYDFNTHGTPILLSLDARPMWNFLGDTRGFGYGAALGIKYVF